MVTFGPLRTTVSGKGMNPSRRRTIHEAMVRFADGDRSAIDVLVEELWPVLLDFARRGLRNDTDAEDVAQEVFVRLCSRIADFDRSRDGLSWAFGIAAYEVLTQRRRLKRRAAQDASLDAQLDPAIRVDERLAQEELLAALTMAMGELTASDRAALGIAHTTSDSAEGSTQRKRKQRALERLRTVWRSLYGEP
jgi:RNA polymerase sigma factor (sigma-70 family)